MSIVSQESALSFDAAGIQMCQRNRYPLLMIDQAIEVVPGKSAKCIKNFSYNEWFFPAHFDDEPNVPGFLQLESLIQSFFMTILTIEEVRGKEAIVTEINHVKFKKKLVPGDTLLLFAVLDSFQHGIAAGRVESFVEGIPAASGDFIVQVPSIMEHCRNDSEKEKFFSESKNNVCDSYSFDVMDIQKYQKNRHPVLFIDKAPQVVPGKYANAIKNFTSNEWFFSSLDEKTSYVPVSIQSEALVQTLLMSFLTLDGFHGRKTNFVSINHAKFEKKIVPGDTLEIHAVLDSFRRGLAKGRVESFVAGEPAASAEFMTAVPDVLGELRPQGRGGR